MKSQNQLILEYLKAGNTITRKKAMRYPFYCANLPARILELRSDGIMVVTTMVKNRTPRTGNPVRYAHYSLGES